MIGYNSDPDLSSAPRVRRAVFGVLALMFLTTSCTDQQGDVAKKDNVPVSVTVADLTPSGSVEAIDSDTSGVSSSETSADEGSQELLVQDYLQSPARQAELRTTLDAVSSNVMAAAYSNEFGMKSDVTELYFNDESGNYQGGEGWLDLINGGVVTARVGLYLNADGTINTERPIISIRVNLFDSSSAWIAPTGEDGSSTQLLAGISDKNGTVEAGPLTASTSTVADVRHIDYSVKDALGG